MIKNKSLNNNNVIWLIFGQFTWLPVTLINYLNETKRNSNLISKEIKVKKSISKKLKVCFRARKMLTFSSFKNPPTVCKHACFYVRLNFLLTKKMCF